MTLIRIYSTRWVWLIGIGIFWVQRLRKWNSESDYDSYLFCNLYFFIVFRLIIVFSVIPVAYVNRPGDNIKVNIWREAKKMCSRWKWHGRVLITGIVKWNRFPMSLNNKCSIRMWYLTGILVKVDEKLLQSSDIFVSVANSLENFQS